MVTPQSPREVVQSPDELSFELRYDSLVTGLKDTSKTHYGLSINDSKLGLEPTIWKGLLKRSLPGSYLSTRLGLVVLVAG